MISTNIDDLVIYAGFTFAFLTQVYTLVAMSKAHETVSEETVSEKGGEDKSLKNPCYKRGSVITGLFVALLVFFAMTFYQWGAHKLNLTATFFVGVSALLLMYLIASLIPQSCRYENTGGYKLT